MSQTQDNIVDNKNYQDASDILRTFLDQITPHAVVQRTVEWYDMRRKIIGGSEVASVLGQGFGGKKLRDVVMEKIGITKFKGNAYTNWGILFEPLTREWCEKILEMKEEIVEIGSMPTRIPALRYSPDGIGLVKIDNKWRIILFEFKSPWGSIPDGKIPSYYVPQVLTGLMAIELCEAALFVNNMFRKCSLKQVSDTNWKCRVYDTNYHNDAAASKKKNVKRMNNEYSEALAAGIILFVIPCRAGKNNNANNTDGTKSNLRDDFAETASLEELEDITKASEDDAKLQEIACDTDLGEADAEYFNTVLYLFNEKKIEARYLHMNVNENESSVIAFSDEHKQHEYKNLKTVLQTAIGEELSKGSVICGHLPYKLMASDIIYVEPNQKWHDIIRPKIDEAIELINNCVASANPYGTYLRLTSRTNATTGYTSSGANRTDEIPNDFNGDDSYDDAAQFEESNISNKEIEELQELLWFAQL
jgi:hypothetical protein